MGDKIIYKGQLYVRAGTERTAALDAKRLVFETKEHMGVAKTNLQNGYAVLNRLVREIGQGKKFDFFSEIMRGGIHKSKLGFHLERFTYGIAAQYWLLNGLLAKRDKVKLSKGDQALLDAEVREWEKCREKFIEGLNKVKDRIIEATQSEQEKKELKEKIDRCINSKPEEALKKSSF